MDKDFMLNYYDKMVRPIWTELMKTHRYQRAACERDKIEREFRRLLDEKLGRKYLELDDALFRVMDDIAEAMYMKGAADREMMIGTMSKKIDHIDDTVSGFFSFMHMVMQNELGNSLRL